MDEDLEKAVDEALGGGPRASEIAGMIAALQERRDTVAAELRAAAAPTTDRSAKVAELDRHIALLQEDMAISSFVEGSVRVALARQLLEEEVG